MARGQVRFGAGWGCGGWLVSVGVALIGLLVPVGAAAAGVVVLVSDRDPVLKGLQVVLMFSCAVAMWAGTALVFLGYSRDLAAERAARSRPDGFAAEAAAPDAGVAAWERRRVFAGWVCVVASLLAAVTAFALGVVTSR